MSSAANSLRIRSLSAGYGGVYIVKNVNIDVTSDEVAIVTGPNGCGKSTLLRSIAGLTTIYDGSVSFGEREIRGRPPWELVHEGIVYSRQGGSIFPDLSVAENLRSTVRFGRGLPRGHESAIIDTFPVLAEKARLLAGNLSGGERQVLSFARALMLQPRLLLLDEPTSGLAATTAKTLIACLTEWRVRYRFATMVVEHESALCHFGRDRVESMAEGRIT